MTGRKRKAIHQPTSVARLMRLVVFAAAAMLVSAIPAESNATSTILGPPDHDGPVEVRFGFFLDDVSTVDEAHQTFEFEALITLEWSDPRQAFDPRTVGADEKIFQGSFQFNEVFTGWWPQIVLANKAGAFESQGVMVRISPRGDMTLITEVHSAAEMPMELRRFPFDKQSFEAVFMVLGFDSARVTMIPYEARSGWDRQDISAAEWELLDVRVERREHRPFISTTTAAHSQIVISIDAARRPQHMLRDVVLPLTLLVILTFSVFWMDRESLGDRMDISFIGVLTVVAYQIIVSDTMPAIPYYTMMSGFLLSTYLVLAVGVLINLVVSKMDQSGRVDLGTRIDEVCRWAVPLGFFGANALSAVYFILFH